MQEQFYTHLPAHELPLSELLAREALFVPLPGSWHVVLTDIKNSTAAVQAGLHEQVNLVATGSIIAALNLAGSLPATLPFFFGGDGATLLVPGSLCQPVLAALNRLRENTRRNFGLELRVGQVPVGQLREEGHELLLAKAKMSDIFSIPVVLGGGLHHAETLIKGRETSPEPVQQEEQLLNLEGMECRWDKITPPKNRLEVVCLLVEAREEKQQGPVFCQVLQSIDRIYGPFDQRQPISAERLRLNTSIQKVARETRARQGRLDLLYLLRAWLQTLIGKYYYFPFNAGGKSYLHQLVKLSDTLVLDGRINTVISGSPAQRQQLQQLLEQMEAEGQLLFGMHATNASIMSCYVRDRHNGHIHFVDGAEGGYTQAAKMLKRKLKGG
ncbi:MAG: DUF3095 domain-containing protein [Bacteroidetes bacterium]|nr:MAG: DUF3095 domain-containing protein [Bacteroidota bacterium]